MPGVGSGNGSGGVKGRQGIQHIPLPGLEFRQPGAGLEGLGLYGAYIVLIAVIAHRPGRRQGNGDKGQPS